ncbi:MAG: response regulator transcription factor [Candidatus Eremiobacteraeota bacterium]|nr:response regulator transcription factor [Candidatus Eremiobacteraeota bacterium]
MSTRFTASDDDIGDPRCFVKPDVDPLPASETPRRRALSSWREGLTARECEVALLLTEQFTNREISRKLRISERTVEHHVQSVLSRLGLRSRFQVTGDLLGQRGCASGSLATY